MLLRQFVTRPRAPLQCAALLIAAFLQIAPPAACAAQTEPTLSAAETAAVNRQIATLHSAAERQMAQGWSNAKKVAELVCRPAALPVLKKQIAGADRVFLGTDDPKTLSLESNELLTGSGSARAGNNWQDFAFSCKLDPETAKVIEFRVVISSGAK
jgi:hypothetical protein